MFRVFLEIVKLVPVVLPAVLEFLRLKNKPEPQPEPVPKPMPEPEPVPEPVPEPDPTPTQIPTDPKAYIPWKDREQWAARVEYCYSVWRGDRDLAVLVSNPDIAAEFKINLDLVLLDIKIMQEFHSRQEPLKLRILNEKHKIYADRCQVRKSKVNDYLAEAESINKKYASWVQHLIDGGVVFGVNYDSIKGYVDYRKKHS